uniref:Uncharacterized protein n=1 Tax=Anguilla anguilla TaxID=7936 RepID=A0A0E9VIH4_ANGAN
MGCGFCMFEKSLSEDRFSFLGSFCNKTC